MPASFLFGDLCSKRNQTGTEVSATAARAELSMLCAGRLLVSGQKSNELAPWIRAEIGLLFGLALVIQVKSRGSWETTK